MVSITIKNLTKKYGNVTAVKNLNLKINDKEFFVFLGPSGCGKTTTLLAVAGLVKVDAGEIWIGDDLVTSVEKGIQKPPQERGISMVFQDYAIYPHMSVYENIAFPLRIRKMDNHEIDQMVKKTAKLLGIAQFLDRKPRQLSGGQRQRVALGRAIVRTPKIFLMDEPLANLDAKLRVQTRTDLKRLQMNLGVTTVCVTHDQVEAMVMADRIMVQRDGEVEQVGTPDELYNSPANQFVAGFVGSPEMNFIESNLIKQGNNLRLNAKGFTVSLPGEMRSKLEGHIGGEVIMGVRPDDLHESPCAVGAEPENVFRMKLELIEPIGPELILHLKAGEIPLVAAVKDTKTKVGEGIAIEVDPQKIHVFDKKTGSSLI
jgi:multiple sugar transport system ATP-binding protein